MSEVKHTAGPWTFYADLPSTEPNWYIVTTANKLRVLANVHVEPGNEIDIANVRLIAAAPDLLAALQALADVAERCDSWESFPSAPLELAHAAIAKATGAAA